MLALPLVNKSLRCQLISLASYTLCWRFLKCFNVIHSKRLLSFDSVLWLTGVELWGGMFADSDGASGRGDLPPVWLDTHCERLTGLYAEVLGHPQRELCKHNRLEGRWRSHWGGQVGRARPVNAFFSGFTGISPLALPLSLTMSVSCFRCLQADSWRLVSAADDKTIKVRTLLLWEFGLYSMILLRC